MDSPFLVPAAWGGAGAFIFAGPRLIACLITCRETGEKPWLCLGEFAVSLLIGAIGAAAFSNLVMGVAHIKDAPAIAAMIGLFANPLAPEIVKGADSALGLLIESPIAKILRRDKPL